VSITDLIAIFHHRWSAPVLAELLRQKGSRFAALVGTLGVGRESLRRTLDSLLELGLVARNPGYGHPLRPEYVLTRSGEAAARRCAKLLESLDEDEVLLRKWSLPVLAALAQPARFSELRSALPGVTPRALALALKDLQGADLVERRIEDAYPPRSVYSATPSGRRLQRIVV
jgi:DNA-binding HxlR family transcriptional regulator